MSSGSDASVVVRPARASDAGAMARIYRPHVVGSPVSFELVPPDAAEMEARFRAGSATHPWLVADGPDGVVGYAYAGPFRSRAAYDWTCESTVYAGVPRRGIGRRLMEALIAELRALGYRTVVAGVTLPNAGSVGLHEALGFVAAGRFPAVGFKDGVWHDVGFWTLDLGDVDGSVRPRPATTEARNGTEASPRR